MSGQGEKRAKLLVPKEGYGGKRYPVKGALVGHEGSWFRAKRGTHHHRVVKVGAEGRSEDISYRVRAADFQEAAGTPEPATAPNREFSVVGQRGAIVLAARLRDRLHLEEGAVVIQEERNGGIWIRPAVVLPREQSLVPATQEALDTLLDQVTPQNVHDEVSTGPKVGREAR